MIYPLYQEFPYQSPIHIFSLIAHLEGALMLDSALDMQECGRYSFIGMDPFLTLKSKNGILTINDTQGLIRDPFEELNNQLSKYPLTLHPALPRFQGGVAGVFSYDLYHHLEKVNHHQKDDMQFPDLALGFYDLIISFDQLQKKAWIFSSGYPELEITKREERARQRCDWLLKTIQIKKEGVLDMSAMIEEKNIQSNFTAKTYQQAVQKVRDYILEGDIFEANISQRFTANLPAGRTPFELFSRLRKLNPAPFSAYINFGEMVIASASPERFLKLTDGKVETRPIKGTRTRGKTKDEDLALAEELTHSEKDRAENVMIVDLLRNDLSRVCESHTVEVPQLCGLESYATVHHLVSVVQGKLQSHFNAVDLLRASFPGGSITGAPKIRAMEIIAEIEPTTRGPYCGSIGYIGFNGDMDTSIAIRTFTMKDNAITFQAGGAIVLDSDPLSEYEETLIKAKALKRALVE